MKTAPLTAASAAALLLTLSACHSPPRPQHQRYFHSEVKPVLEMQCLRCHTGPTPPAGLSLEHREGGAYTRRADGRSFIMPGRPAESLLIQSISRGGTHPRLMPRLEVSLTDDQIGALTEWIEDGAWWPRGPEGHLRAEANPENP